MDFNTFQAKYGFAEQPQTFKSGARAGVIVASVLSILATVVQLLLLVGFSLSYYGEIAPLVRPMSFLPLAAAALMVIAGAAAKPTSKIILAIPASLWAVREIYMFVTNVVTYTQVGFAPFEILRAVLNIVPLYPLVVVLLMWLTCGGVIKNGTVGGGIIAVTSVLGCIISVISNIVQMASVYAEIIQMISLANIVSSIAAMLFYVANAAALFMIGRTPKAPAYGYVPSAYQTPAAPVEQPTAPVEATPVEQPVVEAAIEPQQPADDNSEVQ